MQDGRGSCPALCGPDGARAGIRCRSSPHGCGCGPHYAVPPTPWSVVALLPPRFEMKVPLAVDSPYLRLYRAPARWVMPKAR
jgi:hypothetical protein